jgi:soluble lytic murein transglycosylase-like protein
MKFKFIIALIFIISCFIIIEKSYGTLSAKKVENLAIKTIQENKFDVDYKMLVSMAKVESNFDKHAFRYEPHIKDSSAGLMQTLLKTAKWLATDMGYSKYGIPTYKDLLKPEVSLYFGGAYVNWLSDYEGIPRNEQWIVESYNGGPDNSNVMTRNHYSKYIKAKDELYGG